MKNTSKKHLNLSYPVHLNFGFFIDFASLSPFHLLRDTFFTYFTLKKINSANFHISTLLITIYLTYHLKVETKFSVPFYFSWKLLKMKNLVIQKMKNSY